MLQRFTKPAAVFLVEDFQPTPAGHDIFPALRRCLDHVYTLSDAYNSRGATVVLPFGDFACSKTVHVHRSLTLRGAGGGGDYQGTILRFPENIDGVVLHGATDNPAAGRADYAVLQDLILNSTWRFSNGRPDVPEPAAEDFDPLETLQGCGVRIRTHAATLINVDSSGWKYDGVHIESGLDQPNSNQFRLDRVLARGNGRHGLFISGNNGNQGLVLGGNFSTNRRWGVYDRSFLGNCYVAPLTEANGGLYQNPPHNEGGGYFVGDPFGVGGVQVGTLVSPYAERDQPPSRCDYPNTILGGNVDWGNSTAARIDQNLAAGLVNMAVRGRLLRPIKTYVRPGTLPFTSFDQASQPNYPNGIYVDCTSGHLALILVPASEANDGEEYVVKRTDGGTSVFQVRVLGAGTIDGLEIQEMVGKGSGVRLRSCGTEWRIVGRF